MMVTANNYMFRPLTGHHQVVYLKKRLRAVQYTLESQKHNYTILYIKRIMVTANNYMFRPLTGHHQVVYLKKRAEGCTIYARKSKTQLYYIIYTADDGNR